MTFLNQSQETGAEGKPDSTGRVWPQLQVAVFSPTQSKSHYQSSGECQITKAGTMPSLPAYFPATCRIRKTARGDF
jgi:hypothetical protein